MSKLLAQKSYNLGNLEGIGPFGIFRPETAGAVFESIISGIIGVMTIIAGLWFTFLFIIGAIEWLSSGGDKNKLASAQGKITHGLIGLVIVISAVFFIELISTLLGIPDILRPAKFIEELR